MCPRYLLCFVAAVGSLLSLPSAPLRAQPAAGGGEPALQVLLIGHDHQWHVRYAGPDGRLDTTDDISSRGVLRLPSGRRVRLRLESRDYIYTFVLPPLKVHSLAIPARARTVELETSRALRFELKADPLCGLPSRRSSGRVVIESPGSFSRWLAGASQEESLPLPPAVESTVGDVPESDAKPVYGRVPRFALTDQGGKRLDSTALEGRLWIANFIFTRCAATCPVQTARLSALQRRLRWRPLWREVTLVSFSVDPERDTPEVLGEYSRRVGADPEHWKFLTGDRQSIWDLSTRGFRLPVGSNPPAATSPLFHSSKVALVDREGNIRGYYDGTTTDAVDTLAAAVQALYDEESIFRGQPGQPPRERTIHFPFPTDVIQPPWVAARRAAQLATLDKFGVFTDFGFTDRLDESRIKFHHWSVDDLTRDIIAVHYDHGNSVSIADVDGDGREDIFFSNQVGPNALWRNVGGGRFENITARAGVGLADRIGVAGSFADLDNDGDPDLYVTNVRDGNVLFENVGGGRFRDISKASGLDHRAHSSGVVFFDFDRDGLLDVFLANVGRYTTDEVRPVVGDRVNGLGTQSFRYHRGYPDAFAGHLWPERAEKSVLYRNLGGNRFADVSRQMGVVDASWSGDASALDVNEDGWLDLYVLNMQGHDTYYENQQGKRFVEKSREVFPKTPWGAMGIKVFDHNNDGQLDILITDMHSDMSQHIAPGREKLKAEMVWPEDFLRSDAKSIFGNALYEKRGPGQFVEVSDARGVENYWPWGVSVGDLNADGYEDVFIASGMCFPYHYGINTVLLNNRGRGFLDSEYILGVEPRRDGRTAQPWFELECYGKDRKHEFCEDENRQPVDARVVVWSAVGSRSSVVFDLDQDGDLDIVTSEFNAGPMVLVSNLTDEQDVRFLKVRLRGTRSNRDGLGAVVRVRAGPHTYTKVHDGKSGHLAQSSSPLYFGLGEAKSVDSVEITWPATQKRQVVAGPIAVNRIVDVLED